MATKKQVLVRMLPSQLAEVKSAAARVRVPVSKYMTLAALNRGAQDGATADLARLLTDIERRLDARLDAREVADADRFDAMRQELIEGVAQALSAPLAENRREIGKGLNQFIAWAKKCGLAPMAATEKSS